MKNMKPDAILAMVLHDPIDPNLPVDPILGLIADFKVVDPSEDVYKYANDDANASDEVYTMTNCVVELRKVTPNTPVVLTFDALQTRLEYVCLDEILNTKDESLLGRRKEAMARSMNKKELQETLGLALAVASQEVVRGTGEDLLCYIIRLKQKISIYGDGFILLAGVEAYDEIEKYTACNVTTNQYRINIMEELRGMGIEVRKVIGAVSTDGGSAVPVLATDKLVMIARNSTIAEGTPFRYIRRRISAANAEAIGGTVSEAQRLTINVGAFQIRVGTDYKLAYGVYTYESRVVALINYRAVSWGTL